MRSQCEHGKCRSDLFHKEMGSGVLSAGAVWFPATSCVGFRLLPLAKSNGYVLLRCLLIQQCWRVPRDPEGGKLF